MGGGGGAALFVGDVSLDIVANGPCCAILAYTMLAQEADVLAPTGCGQMAEGMDLLDVSLVVAFCVGRKNGVYLLRCRAGGPFGVLRRCGLRATGQQKEGKR